MDFIKLPWAANDTYAPILLLLQFKEVMKFSLSFTQTHKEEFLFFKERKAQTLLTMLIQSLDKGITDNVDRLNGRRAGKHI